MSRMKHKVYLTRDERVTIVVTDKTGHPVMHTIPKAVSEVKFVRVKKEWPSDMEMIERGF